mmetsp:Transcript_17774/g.29221  ORF Transcript_17774/g.29221 Transcript_17774/m.29221 type:complete len:188 (-) Transcript_17774:737-1300(-)
MALPGPFIMSSAQLENSKSAELDFTAAGILPYCWVPNLGGEAMFLLGEELCWSRRPRDNKLLKGYFWKDFGGRRESEECVEETAAREFSEETLGVFANDVAQAATNSGVLQSTRMMLAKLLSARDQVDGHDGIFKAKNDMSCMLCQWTTLMAFLWRWQGNRITLLAKSAQLRKETSHGSLQATFTLS